MSGQKHGFALHGMLQGVVNSARARMEKTAAECDSGSESKDSKEALPPFLKKKDDEKPKEKTAFDYTYCEKLAGAVDFIGQHLAEIEDGRSNEEKIAEALVIAEALGFQKTAVGGPDNKDAGNAPADLTPPKDPGMGKGLQTGPAPSNALANDADSRPGGEGEQPYKHDKAKTMTLPKDPKLTNPEGATGSSTTALETDQNAAPGGNSGSVPTAGYPDEGPIREKGASAIPDRYERVLAKLAFPALGTAYGALTAPEGQRLEGAARGALGETVGGGIYGVGRATQPTRAAARAAREKQSAVQSSPVLNYVLAKLAEDNAKTNISAGSVSSTVVDGGDFPGTPAEEGVPKEQKPAQASMVASNQAVVDATKREAKAPQKQDLAKVLDEPALSQATDSKLQENLGPVVAASGAKIAGVDVKTAAARELFRRVLAGDEGPEKEAALKTAMQKLAEESSTELGGYGDAGSQIAYEDEQADVRRGERTEQDFSDILEAAAQAQGEGLTNQAPPAAAPDVPDMV
ncbi:MAG: hypothetical protein ABH877_04840 [bacterium]